MRVLFVAPSGRGKTYLFTQWMLGKIKEKWIEPKNIIIFAYNFMSDPSLAPLLKKCQTKDKQFLKTHCFKEIDEDLLLKLFDSQEIIKDE